MESVGLPPCTGSWGLESSHWWGQGAKPLKLTTVYVYAGQILL